MDRLARLDELEPLIVDGHSEIAILHDHLLEIFGLIDPDAPYARRLHRGASKVDGAGP